MSTPRDTNGSGQNSLEARLDRLRRVRDAVHNTAIEAVEKLLFVVRSIWRMAARSVRPAAKRLARTPVGRRLIRAGHSGRDALDAARDVTGSQFEIWSSQPWVRRRRASLRYAFRWLDLHHRLYTARARRYLRHYLVVLIDPRVPRRRRAIHAARGLGVTAGAGAALLALYMLLLIPLTPGLETIRQVGIQHPATVLDVRGEVVTRFRRINREWVDLEQVSPYFLNALLTTEDRRFFDHFGIDLRRMFGAGLKTATGDLQGASTLTQQLARNLFPREIGRRITIDRKLREIVTALKIEAVYSKDEILESYINTVPFLFNAVGLETAAQTYFNTSAAELDMLESATLVGMLKGTFYYNPVRNPERAVERRNLVLDQMRVHGALTAEESARLAERPLEVRFEVQPIRASKAPHFTEHVRRWLVAWADRNGYNIHTDSLLVHTGLDLRMQQLAQSALMSETEALQAVADVEWARAPLRLHSTNARAYLNVRHRIDPFAHFWSSRDSLVAEYVRATSRYERLRAAGVEAEIAMDSLRSDAAFMDSLRTVKTRLEASFLAIEPRTGHIKAWVGSRDFEIEEYDHVALAQRQAGSTFKPFLYAAALERGYSPSAQFVDREVVVELSGGRVWRPSNSGKITGRRMTMREGLAQSVNTISAQLVERVGAENVADLARRAGIHSELEEVPSIALGTSSVTLKEMVTAYATLAAGGIYREPVSVLRIEDRRGHVLYEAEPVRREVIDESVTEPLVDMMRGVIDEGTGRRIRFAYDIDTDVAGKTGTTQEGADGWFILMHPDLVAGSWVGFNDRRVTFRSDYWGQGAHTALPIVGHFYREALRDPALELERRPAPPPRVRYVRVERRGVSGWFKDMFEGPEYRRVEMRRSRPLSDLGRRLPSDASEGGDERQSQISSTVRDR